MSTQDLFPWLSALFVKKNFSGKSIGQKLQNFLIDYCRKVGFTELFLSTDICDYYEKLDGNTLKMVLNIQGII